MPWLRVDAAPEDHRLNQTVELDSFPFSIGRVRGCSLILDDQSISRRHVEIREAPDGCWVLDLKSANGTRLNGEPVERAWLKHGDRLEIGLTTFVFEERAAETVIVPPTPPVKPIEPVMPPAAVSRPPANRHRTKLWLTLGCLTLTLVPVAALLGWWVWTSRLSDFSFSSEGPVPSTERDLIELDLGIPPAAPLNLTCWEELGSTRISAEGGGSLETSDGLRVNVPPGALPDDRTITIRRATVPAPVESVALIGGGDASLSVLRSWDIDAGPSGALFPGEIELSVRCAEGEVPLYAAISVDGVHWTRVPSTIDGSSVTFTTRHFCPVTIIGLSQAAVIVLPVVAITYLVIERADELPDSFHPYAPFVSTHVNPKGFEIYWSKSLSGVDKRTGFRDETRYRTELERVAKEYGAIGGGGTTGSASMRAEIAELKRKYLMPDKVREIEDALVYAQSYLASRRIAAPVLSLPVYVVPTMGGNTGMIHNPWAGRRYMMVGADSSRDAIWTTALHELFHHYQTGYVWLDRTGHLPFVEASALLIEREAVADYKAAGKPFNTSEGLALAQMLVYRNGLEGPKEWKEDFVRRHGYGLTWFLEYLRDEKYVGITKKHDPKTFHAALLTEWGRRWTGATHKGLLWAAGGERDLASAWMDFAKERVLAGPVDRCGSRNPFGAKYGTCPLSDSPYAGHADDYGLPASRLDLMKTPVVVLDDGAIPAWSIQFYEITAPSATKSSVVLRVPRSWFPKSGTGRGVLLRETAADVDVESIVDADLASPSHSDVVATLPAGEAAFAYIVDTGQTGSGWISSNPPMTIFLLSPPDDVKSDVSGKVQKVRWSPPVAAATPDLIQAVRLYPAGSSMPERTLSVSETAVDLDITGSARAIELTSAVEIGRDASGEPIWLESPRSDPVGGADAGNYEMCVDISAEITPSGSECSRMNHYWSFLEMKTCFPVDVTPDGGLRFNHEWKRKGIPGSRQNVSHKLRGQGTFLADRLDIKVQFESAVVWDINGHHLSQSESGAFEGHGKYMMGQWFGEKVKGTFSANVEDDYCAGSTNGECNRWEHTSSSCTGRIAPILSSIDSFKRK